MDVLHQDPIGRRLSARPPLCDYQRCWRRHDNTDWRLSLRFAHQRSQQQRHWHCGLASVCWPIIVGIRIQSWDLFRHSQSRPLLRWSQSWISHSVYYHACANVSTIWCIAYGAMDALQAHEEVQYTVILVSWALRHTSHHLIVHYILYTQYFLWCWYRFM